MKNYRIYTIEQEYIFSDYYDEDGYRDDCYDEIREEQITNRYVDSLDKAMSFVNEKGDYNEYQYEEIEVE